MSDKQTTPMKKLSHNLRLLRQQLSNTFDVLELTETQTHSYRYEYTKGVKSDYILIFTSKSNKEINFAFAFNYKGELESDYTIDITIKEKDGNIKTINKFSYIKFKEVLNNMVSLGIRDESIVNFILLLENVKDVEVINIANTQKKNYDNLEAALKASKLELYEMGAIVDKKYSTFSRTIKNSSEYEDWLMVTNQLQLTIKKLKLHMQKVNEDSGLQDYVNLVLSKKKEHENLFINSKIKPKLLSDLEHKYSIRYGWCKNNSSLVRIINNDMSPSSIG